MDFRIINDDVKVSWAATKSDPRINDVSILERLNELVNNGFSNRHEEAEKFRSGSHLK